MFSIVSTLTIKEKGLYFLILLFMATLYFSQISSINIIVMAILALYCFFYNSLKEKISLLKERKHIIGMLLYFAVVLISLLISDNRAKGLRNIELQLPLLLFPMSLGLIYIKKEIIDHLLLAFAYITTLVCCICLLNSIYSFTETHRNDIFFNDNLTLAVEQQSSYVAFLVTLSIFTFCYHLLNRRPLYKTIILLSILFLFGISFLLASRVNLVVLIGTSLLFAIYYIIKQRQILIGFAFLLGLALSISLVIKVVPQTLNRFKELTYSNYTYEHKGEESHFNVKVTPDQWNGANFRLAAWNCGWELFKENPVLGVGIGDKKKELLDKYREKNFYFALQTEKNIHSNYVDILYSLGALGFVAFLFGWIFLPISHAIRNKNRLGVLIMITFIIAWISEVYFSRALGSMTTGFFVTFLLLNNKAPESKTQVL